MRGAGRAPVVCASGAMRRAVEMDQRFKSGLGEADRGMEVMAETSDLGLTVLPIVVAACLAYYARAMRKKGVLG